MLNCASVIFWNPNADSGRTPEFDFNISLSLDDDSQNSSGYLMGHSFF